MKKRRIPKLKTTLIVGEGPTDTAFINHLKAIYDGRHTGQRIRVRSSDGGSPEGIVHDAIKDRDVQYDRRVILMDSDCPVQAKTVKKIQKKSIVVIQSRPNCLEGMLLEHLGETVPHTSKACKSRLHSMLSGDPTESASYSQLFSKDSLDNSSVEEILQLIEIISNN